MSPRLFLHVVSLEARTRLGYRGDFWINATLGIAAQFVLVWFLWTALFQEAGEEVLAGFDLRGILLYYGAVILAGKFVRGPELERPVAHDIYEGGLNRYLLFPTPYFSFKYAQQLGVLTPIVMQIVLFGALLLLVIDHAAGVEVTPLSACMAGVSLVVANLLYFVMGFPIQAVAFWADNVWSLAVTQRFVASLLGGSMLPLALFPAWSQEALHWLPFRHLYDVPVRTLLGRVTPAEWAGSLVGALLWCGLLGLVARAVWKRGEYQYSGVGI